MLYWYICNNEVKVKNKYLPVSCIVFQPRHCRVFIGSRVIAHWPSLPAKLAGKVIGIEHGKYYVEYDDGDKHHNTIEQLRILKPPLYFGKLTYYLLACEQTLHLGNINSAKKWDLMRMCIS